METNAALFEPLLALLILLPALGLRPWRLLGNAGLHTPLLATLALLPLLWALPFWHAMPLQLQWSGACLVTLCLGWPLAVPVLSLVGAITWLITPATGEQALALVLWQGMVPATLALALGGALRRWLPHHPFVYVLGRGFFGTALCAFVANLLAQSAGHTLPNINPDLSRVALWLMAWGDAFVTGMMAAIFVAYRPQWLATWSDRLYLDKS
jgi:uncharacterized membrane protein